jgi:hypothetical protein
MLGWNAALFRRNIAGIPGFVRDLLKYKRRNRRRSFSVKLRHLFPVLTERKASAGTIGGDYFHQDLWAARKIFRRSPAKHVDIGSRTDGFVAHLLTFMDITVIDIRPLESNLAGLTFIQDDATTLASIPSDSIDSLSSLHVAEHFGLGRYGDPIDPEACFTFMQSLQRVLSPGGILYFSVPIGRERVEFNAHRVFSTATILSAFSRLHLISFGFVGEDGCLYENADPSTVPDSWYLCGLFEFTKL